jgi:hypothetical protein
MRLAAPLVVSCLVLAGCASSPVASSSLGEPVTLAVGDSAAFPADDLRIGLSAVREDSRCPPAVACVWEGMATVVAWAEKGSEPRRELILATADRGSVSTRARFPGYEIELLGLAPPNSGNVRQAEYRATLVVRAN